MRENQTSLTALPRRLTSKRPFEGILPFSFNNVLITDPPSLVGQFKERSNEVSYTSGAHSPFGSVPNNYRYVRSSRLIVNHRRRRHTFQRKPPSANFYIPLYPPSPNRARNFLHTEYIVCYLGLTPTNVAALIAAAKRLACERPPGKNRIIRTTSDTICDFRRYESPTIGFPVCTIGLQP